MNIHIATMEDWKFISVWSSVAIFTFLLGFLHQHKQHSEEVQQDMKTKKTDAEMKKTDDETERKDDEKIEQNEDSNLPEQQSSPFAHSIADEIKLDMEPTSTGVTIYYGDETKQNESSSPSTSDETKLNDPNENNFENFENDAFDFFLSGGAFLEDFLKVTKNTYFQFSPSEIKETILPQKNQIDTLFDQMVELMRQIDTAENVDSQQKKPETAIEFVQMFMENEMTKPEKPLSPWGLYSIIFYIYGLVWFSSFEEEEYKKAFRKYLKRLTKEERKTAELRDYVNAQRKNNTWINKKYFASISGKKEKNRWQSVWEEAKKSKFKKPRQRQ